MMKGLSTYRSLHVYRACFASGKKWDVPETSTTTDPKPFDEMPGPARLPFVKCLWVFMPFIGGYDASSLNKYYMKLYKKYGPYVRFDTPERGIGIFVFDPQDFRLVFGMEGPYPQRPMMNPFMVKYRESKPDLYPSLGLFFQDGPKWKQLRGIVQKPMFTRGNVDSYMPDMEKVAKDFIEKIRQDRNKRMEINDFHKKLFPWALESLGTFVLHKRLGCLDKNVSPNSEPRRLITAVGDTFKSLREMEFGPVWNRFFPSRYPAKLANAQGYFAEIVGGYVREATENLIKDGPRMKGKQPLILDDLLLTSNMQVDLVYGIVMDLFFAGIDTTSSTMAFLLYWLGSHPEKQEKLREEILGISGDRNRSIGPNFESFNYLTSCVKETLRLTPVTVGTARILDIDLVLGGYTVPKDTNIAMIFNVTSRMDKYYERPDEFIPERWISRSTNLKEMREAAGLSRPYVKPEPYATLPFGFGIRGCIGRRFAELEMNLLLVKIMQNFRVEYNGPPISAKLGVINAPDRPLNLVFREL